MQLTDGAEEQPRRRHGIGVWVRRLRRAHLFRFVVAFLAGVVVVLAMRIPQVQASFLGEPDRQMLEMAFKIRSDLVRKATPVLFLDIDDPTVGRQRTAAPGIAQAPPATAPRGVVANLLNYVLDAPPGRAAKVVILDVDLATPTPGDEAGVQALSAALERWARTPAAPTLVIARQAFPGNSLGVENNDLMLPATPYDATVESAPNMFWGGVKVLVDQNNIVREFQPYECVRTKRGLEPLYSAVALAYGVTVDGKIPEKAPIRTWLTRAATVCHSADPAQDLGHGELLNYHLSLGRGQNDRVWPDVDPSWPGLKPCGGVDPALVRRLSAADVADVAGQSGVSHDVLCRRIVLIGGTNTVAGDFQQTPLNEMAGAMIIANGVRGLELSDGGLKRVPWWVQMTVLLVMSAAISAGFSISNRIREHYIHLKTKRKGRPWLQRLLILPLNPVILQWVFALSAHWVGVGLSLLSLDFGYWGYVSAPAFAAAAVNAIQEFADEELD